MSLQDEADFEKAVSPSGAVQWLSSKGGSYKGISGMLISFAVATFTFPAAGLVLAVECITLLWEVEPRWGELTMRWGIRTWMEGQKGDLEALKQQAGFT